MSNCTGCKEQDVVLSSPCEKPKKDNCGCTDKVDLICSYYTGVEYEDIGIEKNMNGNIVIQILAEYMKAAFDNINQDSVILQSVGDGVMVYKGLSDEYRHEFKSIVQKDGVKVEDKGDTIEVSVDSDWVKTIIENHLNESWFTNLLKQIFNGDEFKEFFANYIKNLILGGDIDICELVQDCIPDVQPINYPPTITGDVSYSLPNRGAAVNLSTNEFLNRYSDPENDELVAIRITGGNLDNVTKGGIPLTVGMTIPLNEIPQITFNTANQDSGYTQTILYVGINELGQETN